MSQNPYATPYPQNYPQPGYPPAYIPEAPARTSVLAVLSLICSIICCIPGLSVLGVLLGGLALLGIGMSGGRVKGVGLAIAGLILGIIVTVIWAVSVFTIMAGLQLFGSFTDPTMKALAARDGDAVRSSFVASAHGDLTDRRIAEFAELIESEFGTYQRPPQGLGDWISGYSAIFGNPAGQQAMQTAQDKYGNDGVAPLPLMFDGAWHGVFVFMDEHDINSTTGFPKFQDLGILRSDGTIVWIVADAGSGETGLRIPGLPNLPRLPRFTPPGGNNDDPDDEPEPTPAPADRTRKP